MAVNGEDHEVGVKELESLYDQLVDEYFETSEVATLCKALKVIQDLVDRIASGPDLYFRAWCLVELFRCQKWLSEETNDLIHLEKAIDAGRESFPATSESSHLRKICAANLSVCLAKRAKGVGDDKDLQDALAMARVAVSIPHKNSSHRNFALSTLAIILGDFYQSFGDDCHLDEAIEIGRELVLEPSDSRAVYLSNLSRHLTWRGGQYWYGKLEDLLSANTLFAEVLDAFPKGHKSHTVAALQSVDCLIYIAEKTNEAHWLDEANTLLIPLESEATTQEHLSKIFCMKGKLYHQKYQINNKVRDLTMAIEAAEAGLRQTSLDSPYRGVYLKHMSYCLATRAKVLMSQEDIDAGIEYATEYLTLAANRPAGLLEAYNCVGKNLWTKYKLFGGVTNLIASINAYRNTLRLLPEDDASAGRPISLHNLAVALGNYHLYTGQVEWLNEAIQLEREAASSSSKLKGSDDGLSMILHGLSIQLSSRYGLTGNGQDLVEAVSAAEKAVACTVISKTQKCMYLQCLSMTLKSRYLAEGNIDDLDRAIVVALEALLTNSGEQYSELYYASTYANALETRYDATGNMHDLDLAILTQRKIVATTPKSSHLRFGFMHNLGLSLDQRYFQGEDQDEQLRALQEAHDLGEQCLNEIAKDDQLMPQLLQSQGTRQKYLAQFMDESNTQLILAQRKLSATTYQQAFNKAYDTTLHRIQTGKQAGSMFMLVEEWDTASKILSECVNMFRQVSPVSLIESDRQHRLRDLSGTSSLACASYLAQGKVEQGIEVFEAGRGIMASIAMHTQDECVAVKEVDASLHAKYLHARQALSQPLDDVASSSHSQDVVAERTAALKEFEEIEDQIRATPGLEKFNRGLSSKELCALALYGPIIAFCTVDQRCDALIVTTEAIEALSLPALSNHEIKRHVQLVVGPSRLSKAKPTKQATANKRMRALLSWLWDAAVSPVLEHLGLTKGSAKKLKPRLWWVASGQLGLLPLHAAGKGKRQPGHNVFAHVISSYVSSFEALAFARERQSRLNITSSQIALVTMPQTPGRSAYLDTDKEVHAIREVFGSVDSSSQAAQFLELCQCSVKEVVQHLQSIAANIFHFACHAEPDPKDPSKSALLLGSDPTAPLPDLLPISELRKLYGPSRMSGPPPRLAYLSACSTAQQYVPGLIDENIHLAAVFQLLGFPAVVGTLWEADDSAAVMIARAFYQELFRLDESRRNGTSQFLPGDIVARALDFAVSSYRQQEIGRISIEGSALLWANFVHIGA